MKKLKSIFIIVIAVFAGLWGIRSYNARRFYVEKQTRFVMDTYVTIYAVGPKNITSQAVKRALDRIQEISIKFNPLDPKSPLYAFNTQGTPITDKEILDLVRIALDISQKSDGAFDITLFPVSDLWGFTTFNLKPPHLPPEAQIKDALKLVGYRHLILRDGMLKKDNPGVAIDLGGIAKGYALEQAARVLKENGIKNALIDAGGDIYALGKKGRKLWRVGIKNPRAESMLGYVEVEDLAVIGSGDYERFFMQDGKRYHHIFNPKTGYPTEGISGVTLIYPDTVSAQAWAKIPFIMGQKKGLELLESIPGMQAIVVTSEGEVTYSKGLKNMLKVVSEN